MIMEKVQIKTRSLIEPMDRDGGEEENNMV